MKFSTKDFPKDRLPLIIEMFEQKGFIYKKDFFIGGRDTGEIFIGFNASDGGYFHAILEHVEGFVPQPLEVLHSTDNKYQD